MRLAHPLYGEVRRSRSPETRLRRLRGQVATELASAPGSDEMSTVVRRASLILDSDLTPDTNLVLKAAGGAVWAGDLRLADRLAKAAIRAGGSPRASFLRAHALSWFPAGQEAEAVLADLADTELSDDDRGRLAYQRALNMLWAVGDAARAKEIIDDAARGTPPRMWIDAFLTVYWFALDQPQEALEGVEKPRAGGAAGRRGRRDRVGACGDARGCGTHRRGGGRRRTRGTPLHPGSSTPRRCDSTSPTRTSPPCCWRAGSRMGSRWHNACASRAPRCPVPPSWSVPRSPVGPRSSRAGSTRRVRVWATQHRRCPRREMRWAGDTATTFHTPQRWLCGVRRTRRPRCSPRSQKPGGRSASWITSKAWHADGWSLGRAPSPRRSPRCCRPPKPLPPKNNSPRRCYACRRPSSSVITRAPRG